MPPKFTSRDGIFPRRKGVRSMVSITDAKGPKKTQGTSGLARHYGERLRNAVRNFRNAARLPLISSDLENLRASGLLDATLLANGVRSETSKDVLATILNCEPSRDRCLGGMVFPYRRLDGSADGFARVRPHIPRTIDGKQVKYEQPAKVPLRAYFPVECLEELRKSQQPIFITEGEKKALALAQIGMPTIGLGGVWCWKKKDTDELIDDLSGIPWENRPVYIVFDYDEKSTTRRHVQASVRRLAGALRAAGAREVLGVDLPPGPNGSKQGADDFIASHGPVAFRSLLGSSRPVLSDKIESILTASGRTDAANAKRLTANFGERIRWVGLWDKWTIWDGRRWRIDQSLKIEAFAKDVSASLWNEISKIAQGTDSTTLKAIVSFVAWSNSNTSIRNMVAMARSEPGTSIGVDELDRDCMLLNVENGTLDLRTGVLRNHRQDDLITKLAPVTFDPKASCPVWLKFLDSIFANHLELVAYMQRLAGYCLTGSTEEHLLPFAYGVGANGKSTFMEVLLKLLGPDYSMKAPPDLLLAKRGESHPTERADLFGKRLVACIETEEGRRLAESLVKELTGGDRVRARRMREDFWEFTPTHHVWLAGNYKPTIRGTDNGIWRRVKLIPFDVTIPDKEQDKKLPGKLAAEMSGILNWALEGCLEWQHHGLQEPEIVQAATREYSNEMDEVGQFLDEHCEAGPDFVVPATVLFLKYQQENPGSSMTQQTFGASLGRRGFTRARITKGAYKAKHGWKGLRLRPFELSLGKDKK